MKRIAIVVFIMISICSISLSACNRLPQGVETVNLQNNEEPTENTTSSPKSTAAPANETDVNPVETTSSITYPIVDTDQGICYDNETEVTCPSEGDAYFGQDAQYTGYSPSYTDNGDGTVTDNITGLMWQQDPGEKMSLDDALTGADSFTLAGYDDWRLPTIKELYSLILFSGTDVSICMSGSTCSGIPFIDSSVFDFEYGDTSSGERIIDSQWATSTKYVSTTMNGAETMFGVNFADGRIKGYPIEMQGSDKSFFVIYVRGNLNYGENDFVDNQDGTISDNATGLMWMQSGSGSGMDWEAALSFCEMSTASGYDDWRLPNVKELQSIVDYDRSPDTTNSAAIDPIFAVTAITNEAGQMDYPFYWSSTTHVSSSGSGSAGAYVSFGRAMGNMNGWIDVHGAGAQRSDPKSGDAAQYADGRGPQGDAVHIDNYVRCVRGADVNLNNNGSSEDRESIQYEDTTGQETNAAGLAGNQITGPNDGQEPPQEAIDACLGLNPGDACQINTPNGLLEGSCAALQELTCVPQNKQQTGQPPQKP